VYHAEQIETFRPISIGKNLSTKFYYVEDLGTDDIGEIDLYKDNKISGDLSFLGLDYVPDCNVFNWTKGKKDPQIFLRGWGFHFDASIGTTLAGDEKVAVFSISPGIFLEITDFLALELGYVYGVSPDGRLDSTQRDDSALYYGVRLDWKRAVKFWDALVKSWN
jgi:hypothetical protein